MKCCLLYLPTFSYIKSQFTINNNTIFLASRPARDCPLHHLVILLALGSFLLSFAFSCWNNGCLVVQPWKLLAFLHFTTPYGKGFKDQKIKNIELSQKQSGDLCSLQSKDAMCVILGIYIIAHIAAFCTSWSFQNFFKGSPYILHYSSALRR